MSNHNYTAYANPEVQQLLQNLLLASTQPHEYQQIMTRLGQHLITAAIAEIPANHHVNVVCTVEDADFLARGIVDSLQKKIDQVTLSCFWNHRQKIGAVDPVSVAPSFRRYLEPTHRIDTLIVVKSIISGSCVVKTNLLDMLAQFSPEQILILAPVMHKDAQRKLEAEFEADIVEKFHFYTFAIDDIRQQDGTVMPGIGGNVYERLGFGDQDAKNRYTPQIVKERRALVSI